MGGIRPSEWSDEDNAAVRSMWAEGKSDAAIAKATGWSRSKVQAQRVALGIKKTRQERPTKFRTAPVPVTRPMQKESPPPTDARMVPLLDLQPADCRWPIGDPHQPGFGFCGIPVATGKANNCYCLHHLALAWQPRPEKRRRVA